MKHIDDDPREVSVLKSAVLSGGEIPTRILLAPWGEVESMHGTFVIDAEGAAAAIEAFAVHGTDVPIDFEHQTLGGMYASPSGQAPAAGWIKQLHVEPGVGLLADIEWTGEAKELLAGKQYRYLSPVAVIRKADRKLVAIHSAALTNKPAIVGMAPIVNRAAGSVDRLESRSHSAIDHLRGELNLSEESDPEEILMAASARIALLRECTQHQRSAERVMEAMHAGKLIPAQRGWAETLMARDERLFDEWLRTAPVVVPLGASRAPSLVDGREVRQQAAASRAKAEYRGSRLLAALTSEEAYVALAQRASEPEPRA